MGESKTFSVTCAVIWPGRSDRIPVIRAPGMTVPACTIYGEAGLVTRSGLTVRRSTDALTKASFRPDRSAQNPSSLLVFEIGGALRSLPEAVTAGGRTSLPLVEANKWLTRAASISWSRRCCSWI